MKPGQSVPEQFAFYCLLLGLSWGAVAPAALADALIVADEFPAMQVLADRLQSAEHIQSRMIQQADLPPDLKAFQAVVVYIHKNLDEAVERACIQYAEEGGRLILLHHSISSGKRANRFWFRFLGVELPEAPLEQGGYKWIEGVTIQCVRLANHFVTTNGVVFPSQCLYSPTSDTQPRTLPCLALPGSEVYLNHVLTGPRTVLLGLKYTDPQSGKVWTQDTAAWMRSAGKGQVFYFMPGHTQHDFENPTYSRMVLNAVTARND